MTDGTEREQRLEGWLNVLIMDGMNLIDLALGAADLLRLETDLEDGQKEELLTIVVNNLTRYRKLVSQYIVEERTASDTGSDRAPDQGA